jgi:hypothetical protein
VEPHYGEDAPDLIENFMDYASEDCMNMFTNGQAILMRNVLEGPRSGLIEPLSAVHGPIARDSYRLLPNPAQGDFILEFDTEQTTAVSVQIISAEGRLLLQRGKETFQAGKHTIPFDGLSLSPGMYFVHVLFEGGIIAQKLFIH